MSKKKTWLLYDHVFLFIKKCSQIGTPDNINEKFKLLLHVYSQPRWIMDWQEVQTFHLPSLVVSDERK